MTIQYLRAVLERLGQESIPRKDGDVLPVLDVARRHSPAHRHGTTKTGDEPRVLLHPPAVVCLKCP